jgi:hypothetical protein
MNTQQADQDAAAAGETPWLRTWLLGKGEYVHPVLRWAAMPLFRVALLLLLVNVAVGASAWSLLWIVDEVLIVVSVSADVANWFALRARRRRATV